MSGIINKVKDALHSDKAHEQPEGTAGPHSSKVTNAADPRVDSDRDHRANPATGTTGVGSTGHAGGISSHTGTSGLSSTGHTGPTSGSHVTGYDDPTGTHGPHGKVGNTLDPRVDSDADHRAAGVGGAHTGAGPGHGGIGSTGHTGGLGSTGTHTSGGIGSTGTHTSGGIGSTGHTSGLGSTGTHAGAGTTGYDDPAGTHGPHGRVGNVVDPRLDSDRDHRAAPGNAGTSHLGSGPGPASNTAGPHKSDLLNKADPRVDSDLDGSKTVGGNKTYQQ